jgi:hypothetical protein
MKAFFPGRGLSLNRTATNTWAVSRRPLACAHTRTHACTRRRAPPTELVLSYGPHEAAPTVGAAKAMMMCHARRRHCREEQASRVCDLGAHCHVFVNLFVKSLDAAASVSGIQRSHSILFGDDSRPSHPPSRPSSPSPSSRNRDSRRYGLVNFNHGAAPRWGGGGLSHLNAVRASGSSM